LETILVCLLRGDVALQHTHHGAWAGARYIGDPRTSQIPVAELISKQLGARRAKQITDRAQCNVLPSDLNKQLSRLSSDTTYFGSSALSVQGGDGKLDEFDTLKVWANMLIL
jgi:hypothetical protein